MPEFTLELVWLVLSVAAGAIAVALVIFVSTLRNTANENKQWQWVSIFVNAAEQMLGDKSGPERLDWVMAQLKARFPKLDTDVIRAMVEANVSKLRQ